MKILKIGERGHWVMKWQIFLNGQDYEPGFADGIFGPKTREATISFQKDYHLKPDGIVGQKTYTKAFSLGLEFVNDPSDTSKYSINYPPLPNFEYLSNTNHKFKLFGRYQYEVLQGGNIKIKGNWQKDNIKYVEIPQLKNVEGAPENCMIAFHKVAIPQLKLLFIEWEKAGLMHLVKSWHGSFVPRLVRGSTNRLSNHAFGTAFDINYKWNRLGIIPSTVGQEGSVRELVPLANEMGFFWGGHYKQRKDGMHFEIAKIISE
jgi:hypothetical protein